MSATSRPPEIIAHRGASHDAPENTLAAAKLAWAQGADALECDVHLTRDGRLAVVHDGDLQRVSGERIRVGDATLEELRRFDVGSWKARDFRQERVPELSELLRLTPAGKRVFVELKGGPAQVPELAQCVARVEFTLRRLVVISFDLAAAAEAKRALPEAEACWVVEQTNPPGGLAIEELVSAARAARIDGLDLQHDWPVDEGVVQRTHGAGLKLYVWTVDELADAVRLACGGVDGITTNRPGWLRARLGCGEAVKR